MKETRPRSSARGSRATRRTRARHASGGFTDALTLAADHKARMLHRSSTLKTREGGATVSTRGCGPRDAGSTSAPHTKLSKVWVCEELTWRIMGFGWRANECEGVCGV